MVRLVDPWWLKIVVEADAAVAGTIGIWESSHAGVDWARDTAGA